MPLTLPLIVPASAYARIALDNIGQEYPNKLDHVMNTAVDVRSPRDLHPVFFGSYDWHSAVHMHWLLVRLLHRQPDLTEAGEITGLFDRQFTSAQVAIEIAYLHQPSRTTFERTYGWAWLLKLQAELIEMARTQPRAEPWRDALQPLADAFVERFLHFLPLAQFPIRAGTHANSAFGLLLALDYAQAAGHDALRNRIELSGRKWYGEDRQYPAGYEPGGDDFLSGGLIEAALMRRVLSADELVGWWQRFCPTHDALQCWLKPVAVSDRSDPKMAHLDGLNLSRAWCWTMLRPDLPVSLQEPVALAIQRHLAASLPHAVGGDYVGTHWLASFAALALT
ncbi:DUF2891 domain-containing protein [Actimicrobium sp. CCI2.3]|uniref:DUF2891 domain-containing protein n=1 Tax=Actimicrobium sp. CCI2.3 TaxID=3048616 RepID=UPI002AB32F26|nr:DUF2891 domain-containing protein [Actimicrobium sp. CCI2.3]MDY7573441.1 DUF2891 domain-containing protein [Actimicrobium sp. CCI2.3]MEB0022621.1 DUF2891 domain-containing protein [Actimicrobium sp. CCI2.3]